MSDYWVRWTPNGFNLMDGSSVVADGFECEADAWDYLRETEI